MTKKPEKVDGKQLLEDSKNKVKQQQKENKEMKTTNQTIKTIITVIVTLAAVAALVGSFYLGTQFQNGVNSEVTNQVKELATAVTSKQ